MKIKVRGSASLSDSGWDCNNIALRKVDEWADVLAIIQPSIVSWRVKFVLYKTNKLYVFVVALSCL